MHFQDIETTNAVVRARHQAVAEALAASQRRSVPMIWLGLALIWLGEKLRQEVPFAEETAAEARPATSRPKWA